MAWIGPAIIGGSGLLSTLLSDDGDQTSGAQTTTQQPAPRTQESQDIWNAFMGELFGTTETGVTKRPSGSTGAGGDGGWGWYRPRGPGGFGGGFGPDLYDLIPEGSGPEHYPGSMYAPITGKPSQKFTRNQLQDAINMANTGQLSVPGGATAGGTAEGRPGLLQKLQEQGQWLQPKLEEYKGILGDLMTNQGVGAGLLDPVSFQLGEKGSPISFIPRGNRETIGLLQNLASQRLGTDINYPKNWEDLKYLDYLKPMAMDLEKMRHGIPSSTTTGSLQMPGPGLLDQISGGMSIGKEIADIVDTWRTQPSATIPAWESWGYV
jgi:hypothetical protein